MCKKLIFLIGASLLLALAGSAAGVGWTDLAPADHLWSTSGNWTDNQVPVYPSTANINSISQGGTDWPIIQDGINATAGQVGLNGTVSGNPARLTVNGGTLTLGENPGEECIKIAHVTDTYGVLDIYGGITTSKGATLVGMGGDTSPSAAVGTLNMYGGMLISDYLKVGNRTAQIGNAYMNLYSGIVNSNGMELRPYSHTNITNGTMIIAGNVQSAINGYVSDGRLTAFGGDGTVIVSYNGTYTVVTASDDIHAHSPNPLNCEVDIDLDSILSWTGAAGASGHDVYLGTDPESLTKIASNLQVTSYDPGSLYPTKTYYWRVMK